MVEMARLVRIKEILGEQKPGHYLSLSGGINRGLLEGTVHGEVICPYCGEVVTHEYVGYKGDGFCHLACLGKKLGFTVFRGTDSGPCVYVKKEGEGDG